MKKWVRLGAVAAFCASSGWAVDWKALKPRGFVSDFAGVIDAGTKSELEAYCGQVEQSTGVRIALVTLSSLEGEPVSDVANILWGAAVDLPGQQNRVMLILTVGDHHDWVITGAGLKPELTAGLAANILRESRLALRTKDYSEALRAAAETIGVASAKAGRVPFHGRIARRMHWSFSDSIPWVAVAGGIGLLILLMRAGNPAGYGGLGGRGLIGRSAMRRATWGSRGSGGFGGFDSGDSSGGFGGGCCSDW